MAEEDWKDQHYDEVFEGVCLHLEQQRAENPQFTSRKALVDCWSYDGYTNRWAPPL